MDAILRGRPGWEEAIASVLETAPRPIDFDQRFRGRGTIVDRADFPPPRPPSTLQLVHPRAEGEVVIPQAVRQ
jgi:hypothetical protein